MRPHSRPARRERSLAVVALLLSPLACTGADWPTYLHDGQRTASGSDEVVLSPRSVPRLARVWSFGTGDNVVSSPVVADGTVYVGSSDGYEYALDGASGAFRWRTFLGTTFNPTCPAPAPQGVYSTATVADGVLYVGGGDQYWYALDAASGRVLWRILVGDHDRLPGHYNWSSPLIYRGYAYIGVGSLCDHPKVQGKLLQVDLATHQVVRAFPVVPAGQLGGGLWSSPAIDPATDTIYLTTGDHDPDRPIRSQPYANAIIALDAATLAVKSSWQVPLSWDTLPDADWSTTPILVSDKATPPHRLVAAVYKSGYLYAFDRTGSLAAGPRWQAQIARKGDDPYRGDASVSSAAYGNGVIFQAGGKTFVHGRPVRGSVRAVDSMTGRILWERDEASTVLAPLAYADGIVVVGAGPAVQVLSAATGAVLYSYDTGKQIFNGAAIANGRIYVGSSNQNVYAFGLPAPHASGTFSGNFPLPGGAGRYAFKPDIGGIATVGVCAASPTAASIDLLLSDDAGKAIASGTSPSYCNWAVATVSAGQVYTATVATHAGAGRYVAAWSVNGAAVVWSAGGALPRRGATVQSFLTLSAGTVSLSACGPQGTIFDTYLTDPYGNSLAGSTAPTACQALAFTQASPGLFHLKVAVASGTGGWSGTIITP